jgi:HK97 family phage prohead protease
MIKRFKALDSKLEIREEVDQKEYIIAGYFAVFNQETELYPGVYESIDSGAFKNSINGDIRALINHDTSLVLARTTSNTLTLKEDAKGLYGEIKINPNDTDALNIYERVKRGDVSQCSFGFLINQEEVDYRDDGSTHFILKDLNLYEVSVCTFPAYEGTEVEARQKQIEDHNKRSLSLWKKSMKGRLKNVKENTTK